MFGKLTWAAIPLDQPDPDGGVRRGGVWGSWAFLTLILVKGWLPYLWREWITSVDHKRDRA